MARLRMLVDRVAYPNGILPQTFGAGQEYEIGIQISKDLTGIFITEHWAELVRESLPDQVIADAPASILSSATTAQPAAESEMTQQAFVAQDNGMLPPLQESGV